MNCFFISVKKLKKLLVFFVGVVTLIMLFAGKTFAMDQDVLRCPTPIKPSIVIPTGWTTNWNDVGKKSLVQKPNSDDSCNMETLDDWSKTCFSRLKEYRWMLNERVFQRYRLQNKSYESFNLIGEAHKDIRDKHIIDSDVLKKMRMDYALNCRDHMADKTIWLNGCFPQVKDAQSFAQKITVSPGSKICLIGDIHGSIHSLLRILLSLKRKGFINNNFEIVCDNFYIVFTGDFVDRGLYGTEVWYTLLKLINKNWNKAFLLRGNHETKEQNLCSRTQYSLLDYLKFETEIGLKYPQNQAEDMLNGFFTLYNFLPSDLFIGSGSGNNISWVQCCHGGFPRIPSKPFKVFPGAYPLVLHNPKSFLESLCSFERIGFLDWLDSMWFDFVQKKDGSILMTGLLRGDTGLPGYEETITKDSFERRGVKAIFRGHQHSGTGLKMFEIGKEERKNDNMPPIDWKKVVSKEERMAGIFKISDYCPILTLSTATEFGLVDCASYSILTTAENFEDWTLEPYELYLPYKNVVNDIGSLTNRALATLQGNEEDIAWLLRNMSLTT